MIHEIAKAVKNDAMWEHHDAFCKYFPKNNFECLLLKTACLDPLKFLC